MFRTVLVPFDGSELAARALPYAARLARASRGRLVVAQAILPPLEPGPNPYRARVDAERTARAALDALVARLRAEGVEASARLEVGDPVGVVGRAAAAEAADLVVLSTHGRRDRDGRVFGGVADGILRAANVPVLLVPPGAAPWSLATRPRVLVPLDGSALAEAALGPAAALAEILAAALVLLRVAEPAPEVYPPAGPMPARPASDEASRLAAAHGYLEDVAARVAPAAPVAAVRTEVGDPADVVARLAGEAGVQAIALASHGRGGVARAAMGGVATGVVLGATVPILVVQAPTAAGAWSAEEHAARAAAPAGR
jgi:nucleotide-binding universal stress UspA family protein